MWREGRRGSDSPPLASRPVSCSVHQSKFENISRGMKVLQQYVKNIFAPHSSIIASAMRAFLPFVLTVWSILSICLINIGLAQQIDPRDAAVLSELCKSWVGSEFLWEDDCNGTTGCSWPGWPGVSCHTDGRVTSLSVSSRITPELLDQMLCSITFSF